MAESGSWLRGFKAHFPLFDMMLSRKALVGWLERYGIPHVVPRSACLFCPFHSDGEWARIKYEDPEGWKRVTEIDKAMRQSSVTQRGLHGQLFLHRSCKPIDEVEFFPRERPGQNELNFSELDCEGMCGV